jgi:pimeloyl-ACP methyl ester carboxylesterase
VTVAPASSHAATRPRGEERGAASVPLAVPLVFGPGEAQLFGFYHAARGTAGVVLCSPLGHEAMCTHRTYQRVAERLAEEGIHALRFDHHGTGDSSGDGGEPGRLRAWLAGTGAAIEALRAVAGIRTVTLFGVRFGATLAALAAAERDDVRGLVLWAPCVSGRAYVRELRARRMITEPGGSEESGAPGERDEEIAGYPFRRDTVLALSTVDLLAQDGRPAARALVLPRDDLPGGEERLARHLAARGVDTLFRAEPGYARMMRDPGETVVPEAAVEAIVAWVVEAPGPGLATLGGGGAPSSVLRASSPETRCPVREESLRFGEGGRLSGVLTEPSARASIRGRPAVLFLNVGANHRVGPNRMYVTLARDLAALGYLGLRFDVGGLGESRSAAGTDENRLYSMSSVDDVRAAVTLVGQARGIDRVVLLGICSGAYLAFHASLRDPRVVGQILVNPQTFERRGGDSLEVSREMSYKSTRHYLGALLDRRVWLEAIRGGVDVRGVARVLRDRFFARRGAVLDDLMARWLGQPAPRSEVERAFLRMSERGVESLLVFSKSDRGLDMIEQHLGPQAEKLRARRNVRLAIVAGADHTFSLERSRRELQALITRFVERAFSARS